MTLLLANAKYYTQGHKFCTGFTVESVSGGTESDEIQISTQHRHKLFSIAEPGLTLAMLAVCSHRNDVSGTQPVHHLALANLPFDSGIPAQGRKKRLQLK